MPRVIPKLLANLLANRRFALAFVSDRSAVDRRSYKSSICKADASPDDRRSYKSSICKGDASSLMIDQGYALMRTNLLANRRFALDHLR